MKIRWMMLSCAMVAGMGASAWSGDAMHIAAGDDFEGERVLDEAAVIALTAGKTFHYTLLGRPRGAEQHFADGRVTWRLPEGICMHGIWVVQEELLCYYYGALRYGCWNVVEDQRGYRHSPMEVDGSQGSGPSVMIERISEEPVACAPQQLSLLLP